MFGRLFSNRPRVDSRAAQVSIDLINRIRIDRGQRISKPLPVVYATNWEFMGTLVGMVDFWVASMGDKTPVKEALAQVLGAIFADNAQRAYDTVTAGVDNKVFMNALESTYQHLEWVGTLDPDSRPAHLRFFDKFF